MSSARQLASGRTLDAFLSALGRGREVVALEAGEGGGYHLVRSDGWRPGLHTLGAYRPLEPLKSLLFPPREFLGPLFADDPAPPIPERLVIGVKNCDLAGLRIQDHVFLGLEPGDPRYAEARDKTILVTCDCTDCLDTCFCPAVGEEPFCEAGYDINLSPLSGQVVIEAGSERGERLLAEVSEYLAPVEPHRVDERDAHRAAMHRRLVDQAARHGLRPGMDLAGAIRGSADAPLWEAAAYDCVECGACNFVCCTCHCFLLVDGTTATGCPVRGMQWDSCLLMNFARVAGGDNPRARRAARLRNRFEKKFSYFPDVLGSYACDGCGRCIEVCPGHIDIRSVLNQAMDDHEPVPTHPGIH